MVYEYLNKTFSRGKKTIRAMNTMYVTVPLSYNRILRAYVMITNRLI